MQLDSNREVSLCNVFIDLGITRDAQKRIANTGFDSIKGSGLVVPNHQIPSPRPSSGT